MSQWSKVERNQSATCYLGGQRCTLRIVEYKLKCIILVHYKLERVVYVFPVAHLKQTGTSAELKQTRRHDKKEKSQSRVLSNHPAT